MTMRLTSLAFAVMSGAGWLAAPAAAAATFGPVLRPQRAWLSPVAQKTAEKKSYKVGQLVIETPWARATPGGAQVGGGYLKITNTGKEADRLIGGSFPGATSVEVHEMTMTGGVMKMRKVENGLEIKPGQSVELKPGGYHLMFTGLNEGLKQGQTVKGTLQFEKAGSVDIEYRVAPIGAKNGDEMGGEMHMKMNH